MAQSAAQNDLSEAQFCTTDACVCCLSASTRKKHRKKKKKEAPVHHPVQGCPGVRPLQKKEDVVIETMLSCNQLLNLYPWPCVRPIELILRRPCVRPFRVSVTSTLHPRLRKPSSLLCPVAAASCSVAVISVSGSSSSSDSGGGGPDVAGVAGMRVSVCLLG